MAKIFHRKARKDYPDQGIEKGDMYYTAKIKTGPRSSRVLRSKTPLRPSQMTTSPFKSGYHAMMEAWEADKEPDESTIRDAAEACRELAEAASESYENMPEGLQQGDTGQMLETRRDECESKADDLEGFADEYESLEVPEEPDAMDEPTGDENSNPAGWEAYEEWQSLHDDYQTLLAEYDEEKQRITAEAGDLIGDMPE